MYFVKVGDWFIQFVASAKPDIVRLTRTKFLEQFFP